MGDQPKYEVPLFTKLVFELGALANRKASTQVDNSSLVEIRPKSWPIACLFLSLPQMPISHLPEQLRSDLHDTLSWVVVMHNIEDDGRVVTALASCANVRETSRLSRVRITLILSFIFTLQDATKFQQC
jgi:hypothetical protein